MYHLNLMYLKYRQFPQYHSTHLNR
jgi:hypothetical protein